MLSPGRHHLEVPRDPLGNRLYRQAVYEASDKSAECRQALIRMCAEDIIFYTNVFVWQFNPKKKGTGDRVAPFITWDFQDAAMLATPEHPYKLSVAGDQVVIKKGILWCYEHDKTCVVEKSRDVGASWWFLIAQSWLGGFHDDMQMLNISRDEDSVDCKSPDSLFWKLRHIHDHLPQWLIGPVVSTKMYFLYERTRSVNTGEASTGDAGVSGRASTIFCDEFGLNRYGTAVRSHTASTADSRFFNGTHRGEGTEFFKLTQSPEIVKIQIHWSQHPEKCKGMYRSGAVIEVLDKGYVYPPQCPKCRDTVKVEVGRMTPCCGVPAQEFQFVMDGSPIGGPFPGIRSPWYDWKERDIGSQREVAQELDINPRGSVAQYFEARTMRDLINESEDPWWEGDLLYDRDTGRPLELAQREGGPLKLWCRLNYRGMPEPGLYVAGTDVAEGRRATPSCFSLADAPKREKVLELALATLDPAEFAVYCVALCRLFRNENDGPAAMSWEVPGPGLRFGDRVLELGFRNVYWRRFEEKLGKPRNEQMIPGWSVKDTERMLGDYRHALQNRQLVNRSKPALEECLLFTYDDVGKVIHSIRKSKNVDDPSGAGLCHSDRVIADGQMWMMMQRVGVVPAAEKEPAPLVMSVGGRRILRERKEREAELW